MRLIAFFLLTSLCLPVHAQVMLRSADALTKDLSRQFAVSGFPGFSVAVVKNGAVVYQQGLGYADVKSKVPYTPNTVQPVGSVSKTVIGIALMKAVELGYFSLDTHINTVLDFRVLSPGFPDSPITIRQLATHTSGIIDREEVYRQTYLFGRDTPNVSLHDFLASYLTEKGKFYSPNNFAAEPGASFNYSNIGAALAAYLIERKSGMSFAEFAERYILQPLHMSDSGWHNRAGSSHIATLYDPQLVPYLKYASITYPDGNLRSSCADLSKYLIEIIKGYGGGANRLLSGSSFHELLKPQFMSPNVPSHVPKREPNQGIFFAFRRDGSIGHTGSDYGVSAFLFFNPKTSVGKIFLTNIDVQERPELAAQFSEMWKTLDH